jgi:guanylate kinase
MQPEKGLLFVLSGPSGVGKGTVCAALRKVNDQIAYSVSATSRPPREGEVEGVNYFFKTREQFEEMIRYEQFLEWAEYVNNYYGTPRQFVLDMLDQGKDVILEIEVQGALQVKERFPEGVFIFLAPPHMEELRQRLKNRGTESDEVISSRIQKAVEELEMMKKYDYVVVNDEVDLAVKRIEAIILAEHCRQERIYNRLKNMLRKE